MDDEKIGTAIDAFEEDDFMSSSDSLRAEIVNSRNAFLKDKLQLQTDIGDPVVTPVEDEE